MFFILSLLLKGLIYVNLYLALWSPADTITILSVFLCLYIDQYIIEKCIDDDYRGKNFFFFSVPFALALFSQTRIGQVHLSELPFFSLYFILIGLGFSFFFLYQRRLLQQFFDCSIFSRSALSFATYYSLVISFTLLLSSFTIFPGAFTYFIPSQSSLLFLLYLMPTVQAVALGVHILYLFQQDYEHERQVVPELDIWNIAGFINSTESIRHICARLDQDVTLALFRIDNYSEFKEAMPPSDFETFIKTFASWLKFSLRKHDQLALIDNNIFGVLLPFTDLDKGETACRRLSAHTKKEIISQNLLLPVDFSMSFGLTLVHKREENVVPAMKRAAVALSRARPGSVEKYTDVASPARQADSHAAG